ncbi:MAG: hypothetical protein H6862_02285 [Rhodospirillales bacterium]|nr:hypothetical protein [Rhodospirillales bacterium]
MSMEANRAIAVSAWKNVRNILSNPRSLSDPKAVEDCCAALKGTIPNSLNWSGITDFQSHRFWESAEARTALNIPENPDFPALLLALEGLRLNTEFERVSRKLAALEDRQKAYLEKAAALGLGEQAGDTALLGKTDFAGQVAKSFLHIVTEPA